MEYDAKAAVRIGENNIAVRTGQTAGAAFDALPVIHKHGMRREVVPAEDAGRTDAETFFSPTVPAPVRGGDGDMLPCIIRPEFY